MNTVINWIWAGLVTLANEPSVLLLFVCMLLAACVIGLLIMYIVIMLAARFFNWCIR